MHWCCHNKIIFTVKYFKIRLHFSFSTIHWCCQKILLISLKYFKACISKILMRPWLFFTILYKQKINNLSQDVQCSWLVTTQNKKYFYNHWFKPKKIIKLFKGCSHMGHNVSEKYYSMPFCASLEAWNWVVDGQHLNPSDPRSSIWPNPNVSIFSGIFLNNFKLSYHLNR